MNFRSNLLNVGIMTAILSAGHTDIITICDAGFPIPAGSNRIDLALTKGCPSIIQVLEPILQEFKVEKAVMAKEVKEFNPGIYSKILQLLNSTHIEEVDHEQFKKSSRESLAFIRTGECSPFSNIMLIGGIVF